MVTDASQDSKASFEELCYNDLPVNYKFMNYDPDPVTSNLGTTHHLSPTINKYRTLVWGLNLALPCKQCIYISQHPPHPLSLA